MLTKIAVLSGLLMAAPFLRAATSTGSSFHIQPKISYLFMENGPKLNTNQSLGYGEHTFKNTPAFGFSTGISLTENHAVELEAMYFTTKTESSFSSSPLHWYADPTAELRSIPLLIGYKYTNMLNNTWRWYVGTSAGATFLRLEKTTTYLGDGTQGYTSPSVFTNAYKSSALTIVSDLGMEYHLGDRSKMTIGIRSMYIAHGHDTTEGLVTNVNFGYKLRF